PGDSKPGDSKPGDSKPGDSKPGDSKPGDSKPGDSKPGDSKPGDSKPGDSKPGENEPGEAGEGQSGQGDAGAKGSEKSGKGKPKTHSGPASKPAGPDSGKPEFDPDKIGEQLGNDVQQADHAGGQVADSNDPEAEAANLEDRKKAANLVLKKLQEELERGDVNDELLKKLGWTEDDMKKFVDRMSKQQKTAEDEDPASLSRRRQYEEMLKSLNLNHDGGKRADSVTKKQDTTDFLDRGSNVPVEYRKKYEEYTKRMSRKKSQSR
ncbi:MAG: hypothetical protein O2820_17505, partial [Planctomycetota bacterium]|nr:hypothetical protein [Planctomycetota bacterium]